jgi:hypothetical protein
LRTRFARWIDERLPHINIEGSAARGRHSGPVEEPAATAREDAEAAAA